MRIILLALFFLAANIQAGAQTPKYLVIFFDNCLPSKQDSICRQLSDYYQVSIERIQAPFPSVAKLRNGWVAEELGEACLRYRTDTIKRVLAITSRDLIGYNDASSTWGVYGFSRRVPKIAVVSTHLLQGPNLVERTLKAAIHELTHSYGVTYCAEPYCLMNIRSSLTKELDQKRRSVCDSCRALMGSILWD